MVHMTRHGHYLASGIPFGQAPDQVPPIHPGHHHVRDHQIEWTRMLTGSGQRLKPMPGFQHRVPLLR